MVRPPKVRAVGKVVGRAVGRVVAPGATVTTGRIITATRAVAKAAVAAATVAVTAMRGMAGSSCQIRCAKRRARAARRRPPRVAVAAAAAAATGGIHRLPRHVTLRGVVTGRAVAVGAALRLALVEVVAPVAEGHRTRAAEAEAVEAAEAA